MNWSKKNWEQLPRDYLCKAQAAAFNKYLHKEVLPASTFYQRMFHEHCLKKFQIRELKDLAEIPFTSKLDLVADDEKTNRTKELLLIPDSQKIKRRPEVILNALLHGKREARFKLEREYRPIFMTSTTGRSAEPVPFLYTKRDLERLALAGKRIYEVSGTSRDYRVINMFPYAPHLAFWQAHYAGDAFGIFQVSSGGGKVMGTAGNIRLIKKLQPEALIGIPTFIYHVLHQAVEEGVECKSLRKIVLGGEKVEEGMRKKLTSLAKQLGSPGPDVIATYGFTEAKMAFVECPQVLSGEPGCYHLNPDMGIIEVIDPMTEEVLPDGEKGEIVWTPLGARGSVVLRYRTGDIIEGGIKYDACPHCGRKGPRLVGKISRVSNVKEMNLEKLKGTLVDFNHLEHVMENAEHVGAWQLELRKVNDDPMDLDELILHVEKADRVADGILRHELKNKFQTQAEVMPNRIEFHSHKEIQKLQGVGVQLKEEKIVDHRPQACGGKAPPSIHSKRGGIRHLISKWLGRGRNE